MSAPSPEDFVWEIKLSSGLFISRINSQIFKTRRRNKTETHKKPIHGEAALKNVNQLHGFRNERSSIKADPYPSN